jgi:anti-sigma B factor antagonist
VSLFYVISDETTTDDVAVIAMGGEIDFAASPQLRERIDAHIDAGRRNVVLDLTSATFIDSTAIGVLMGALGRLRSNRGSLAVVCAQSSPPQSVTWPNEGNRVREIFRITGLDGEISICDTREEALQELSITG